MHYKREIAERIDALSRQFPAVVLTGARQTGKTTLLRELFPRHHYVSLDLPSAAELAEREPDLSAAPRICRFWRMALVSSTWLN